MTTGIKTVIHLAATLLALAACSQQEPAVPASEPGNALTFEASWEDGPSTRNAIQSNGTSVWWTPGDQILVLKDNSSYGCFTATLTTAAPTSSFAGEFQENGTKSATDQGYVAFYPYGFVNGRDNSGRYVMNLPVSQYGVEGTFADQFFPATARSSNTQLHFHHLCGGACFSVCHSGIGSVTFKAIGGEPLWAEKIGVLVDEEGIPSVDQWKNQSDEVTVLAPVGGFVPGTNYYAAFLPGTLSQGLSIRFNPLSGESQTLTIDHAIQVKRARFGQLDDVDYDLSFGEDPVTTPTTVTYEEADGEVVNPERGMYNMIEIRQASYNLTASSVKAKVATGHKLLMLEFYLKDFMDQDISQAYLDMVQKSFNAIRDGGAKAIVRFAYMDSASGYPDVEMEPDVPQVLAHVAQLKPYLQQNADVIFVLQAGFIGAWGEWYYTSHFVKGPKTDEDYEPRRQLTAALLDAVPVSRQIELRTPRFKMAMYHLSVADTLTASKAYKTTALSRLGGHNDCFGASSSDSGTFDGDDSRKFWKAETRYTIMGGETCKVSDYCLCANSLQDLKDYHWTYLHDGYNKDVLSRWKTDGCMDEIKERLGYRLVLEEVTYDPVKAGNPCPITIRLHNKGFAAPMNPRQAKLVWVASNGSSQKFDLGSDPRTWHSGYTVIKTTFTPSSKKGTLYLELSDPLLPDNPAYSIALANKDLFDPDTGYNKLFAIQ